MDVQVLTVLHRHGENIYVCATEEVARKQLFGYVKENWGNEMPGGIPKREDSAIYDYFEQVQDETYYIDFYAVLTE